MDYTVPDTLESCDVALSVSALCANCAAKHKAERGFCFVCQMPNLPPKLKPSVNICHSTEQQLTWLCPWGVSIN